MIVDIDHGYRNLLAMFGGIGGADIHVDAGVLDDAEVAHYAAINEFGAPERPAFRMAFDTHEAEYVDEMNVALGNMIDAATSGGSYAATLRGALDKLGIKMQGDIRWSILSGPWEQNAVATVRKKGFNHPLLETGRMVESVGYRVVTGYLGGFGQDRAAPEAAEGTSFVGEVGP